MDDAGNVQVLLFQIPPKQGVLLLLAAHPPLTPHQRQVQLLPAPPTTITRVPHPQAIIVIVVIK